MKQTTREKSLEWWNKLLKFEKDELALEYYGNVLVMDSEIEQMYLKEIPEEKVYSEAEIRKICTEAFNLGMDFRMRRLNGDYEITVEEVLNNFFENKLK